MLKTIFNSTWRNLRKRKLQSFIQIFSLALAFAVCIVLFLSAKHELSFDSFHSNKDRLGLLYFSSDHNSIQHQKASETMPIPLMTALKAEVPYVEKASRWGNGGIVLKTADKEITVGTRYVDADFLTMFSFELLQGDKQALAELNNIILTESTAKSLFGHTDVVGKQIEVNSSGSWKVMQVAAVSADVPKNSSLNFQSLQRFENFPDYVGKEGWESKRESWTDKNHTVFIQTAEKLDENVFAAKVAGFTAQHFQKEVELLKQNGAIAQKEGSYLSLNVLPINQLHLNKLQLGNGTNPLLPKILLALALLILVISVSNFINVGIATALTRTQEIAIKKSVGGSRKQISVQLWLESIIYTFFALLVGLFLAWLALPQYKAITQFPIALSELLEWQILATVCLLFLLVTLIAGGYPAIFVTRYHIITLLKNKLSVGNNWGLQKLLPILQFTIAVVLLIITAAIVLQMQYIDKMPLGFNKEQVISIPVGPKINGETGLRLMRQALANQPNVLSVTGSDTNLGMGRDGNQSTSKLGFDYEGTQVYTHWQRVDFDYFETLDIPLIAGRNFSMDRENDKTAVIINEKMARQLGDPQEVIGKVLSPFNNDTEIIGVVSDYNFKDLRQNIEPLTLSIDPDLGFEIDYIFVRIASNDLSASLNDIEEVWKKINPDYNNNASYLGENTTRLYKQEQRISSIILTGGIIAISIACMGLFSAALLATQKRTKEIGVRKVLGSSVSQLVVLLSKDFIRMVCIALIIGLPIAWYLAKEWINNFSYRYELSPALLILCAGGILIIAFLTVSVHTIKAALDNPVNSLRDE